MTRPAWLWLLGYALLTGVPSVLLMQGPQWLGFLLGIGGAVVFWRRLPKGPPC